MNLISGGQIEIVLNVINFGERLKLWEPIQKETDRETIEKLLEE